MYNQLFDYIEEEENQMNELRISRIRRKALQNQAKHYELFINTNHLYFKKIIEVRSIYFLNEEIKKYFKTAHEDYKHFVSSLTLDFFIRRAYWFTKVKNVKTWCRNCHVCQFRLRRSIQSEFLIIQKFSFMMMIDMNWLRSIQFVCTTIEALYVLLMMNYFNRFVWAKVYKNHTILKIMNMFWEHITSVFKWMADFYIDNGSHFVNYDMNLLLIEHEMSHFIDLVNHLNSTGLLERAI